MKTEELLQQVKAELEERDSTIKDLKETVDGLVQDLKESQRNESLITEKADELEKLEQHAIVPTSIVDELSVAIFKDMAQSLTHKQITELDEYAQKNFSSYRKILS